MTAVSRRRTPTVRVGGVALGALHPVVVQSMTNTDTADVAATVAQVALLARAGSELVRVTVNNDAAAAAVPDIVAGLVSQGITVPIIGDFHYNGHLLLTRYPGCARAGQVPHQSRQRRRQAPRRAFPRHHRGRPAARQAGPHRRQLGFTRSGAAHRHDGCQCAIGGTAIVARRDARRDGRVGAALGRVRRDDRAGA